MRIASKNNVNGHRWNNHFVVDRVCARASLWYLNDKSIKWQIRQWRFSDGLRPIVSIAESSVSRAPVGHQYASAVVTIGVFAFTTALQPLWIRPGYRRDGPVNHAVASVRTTSCTDEFFSESPSALCNSAIGILRKGKYLFGGSCVLSW